MTLPVYARVAPRLREAHIMLVENRQMAQGMGLSRLGCEHEVKPGEEPPKWKAPWESLIRREVGRRLWWNVSTVIHTPAIMTSC